MFSRSNLFAFVAGGAVVCCVLWAWWHWVGDGRVIEIYSRQIEAGQGCVISLVRDRGSTSNSRRTAVPCNQRMEVEDVVITCACRHVPDAGTIDTPVADGGT